jgi:sensor histidine kinase YesM/ligand-binding sensor domain-containing protein
MRLIRIYITVSFLFFICHCVAQEAQLNFERVSGTKGVSMGKITGIAQDKFGYMWFVDQVNRCVVRYDGYRMKPYRNALGDTNSITTVGLEAIAADTSGNIWIGNVNGVDKLNFLQNTVTHFYFPAGRKSGYVLAVIVDHLGIVWIGTAEGLFSLDEKTSRFTHYVNNPNDSTSLSCNFVYTIYEDHKGTLWIATGWPYGKNIFDIPGGGLNKFNRQTKTFTQYKHDPQNPHSLINDVVRAVFEDSRGNFWVGTKGDGLHLMNREKGTFERLTYDPSDPKKLARPRVNRDILDHIPFIVEDGCGSIWIGTYLEGLLRYDPDTKEITRFRSESRINGFTDFSCWCAFKSRDGVLWISTEARNLFRVDPLADKFTFTRITDAGWAFLEDPPGTMWIGKSDSGLIKFTGSGRGTPQIKKYFIPGRSEIGINWICRGDSGKYWASSFSGIFQFDPKTGVFEKTALADTKRGRNTAVITLYNDSANNDLYITGIGFRVWNKKNNTLTQYWHDPADSTSISGDTLIATVADQNGNFWIGTKLAGIAFFDKRKKKFRHFLSDLTVFSILVDDSGTVWAGTHHGLLKKEKNADSFSRFEIHSDEAANAAVNSITKDDEGNIWIGSSSGIVRISANREECSVYGEKFGVKEMDWTSKSSGTKASDGKMFLGAINGLYSFYPKRVVNNIKPQTILTGFKIDGHDIGPDSVKVLEGPIEQVREILLNHKQNIFSIDFAAIHFSDPENNIQQYMLEGYDNTWREPGAEKTAYYFNVPPGDYTFLFKATSSYGATDLKSLRIIVMPPWWRTWWAYCLYALLAIVTIWAYIRWRTAVLKKENILLEEKVAMRTKELIAMQSQLIAEKEAKLVAHFNQKFSESELKALRAQMNPHFIFNILNAIESYALDNNKEAASLMIQKFSRLTRMVLENSMSQFVPLKNDLKALQLYIELEQMRYSDKFIVSYNIDDEILEEDYLIPPMIIQPFVENAILHGLRNRPTQNGMLTVSASLLDGYIEVSIEDNGIGRMKAAQLKINNPIPKKSYGIKVTQDRISIFNNLNETRKAKVDIHDLSEGTRVVIQLPVPV